MCGLVGLIAWDERYRITSDQLARMSSAIAHRGPDGEGTWFRTNDSPPACGFAHRRLAIIDPDPRADQPFGDARGRQLIFNGEIYNFRELRAEISSLRPDYKWRTNCDTEVLLAAYDVWGEDCCEHFDGMFAFAIWDEVTRSAYLARDRMGQKPLYLAMPPRESNRTGAIAFASELGALRQLQWVDATIDLEAMGHYLRWGYIPSPLTIYRGCEKLPPARWMRVRPEGIEVEQYFDPNARLQRGEDPDGRHVRELVTSAVRRQLVSDVPLGCFLSGGIDSSIIAAAMKQSVGPDQRIMTFAIRFEDKRYDETRYALEVAKHLKTEHHQFTVRPNAADDLPKLARVYGEPFGDSSALPTHYLARETRRRVKVALSGDGGDEMFAGYDRYRAMWMGEAFRAMPPALRNIAQSKLWERLPGTHPKSKVARVKRMLASLHLPAAQRYDAYMRLFDEGMITSLLPETRGASSAAEYLAHEFERLSEGRDVVETAMALDRLTYLSEDVLTKVDRASMLHALEVRSPFLDPQIVQFAANLTTANLFGTRGSASAFMQSPMTAPAKLMLQRAFAADLPATVFKRPKMGFALPIGEWLRGELRPMLHDSLSAADSFANKHLDRPTIDGLIAEHESEQVDHSQRLYALLMLELWWRTV